MSENDENRNIGENKNAGDPVDRPGESSQEDDAYSDHQEADTKSGKKSDMPFLDHIEELRWRIIKAILAVIILAGLSFAFAQQVFEFITMPLGEVKLHYTEITGSFYAYLKVSFFTGIFLALPVIFYQMWRFIGPGLYEREKSAVMPMVFASTLLFVGGAAFCFFIVMPFALDFLIGYGSEVMVPIITVSSYISFAGLLLVAFGAAFQLPVVGYFLGRLGVVSGKGLGKARPYAVVVFLIGAAILSPPDVFTQILLAGPLYLLYEITIIIVKLTQRKKTASDGE